MRILLIEKNDALSPFLIKALKDSGFAVNHVESLESAKNTLSDTHYDAMVFDLSVAEASDSKEALVEIIDGLRRYAYNTPVVLITPSHFATDVQTIKEKVNGVLNAPFAMEELVGRLKALVPATQEAGPITFGELELDTRFAHLRAQGKVLPLTRKESSLLEALMRRPNTIVDRFVIEQALYGGEREVGPNALEVLVSRLRKKLIAGKIDVQLLTVRGAGYMLMGAK